MKIVKTSKIIPLNHNSNKKSIFFDQTQKEVKIWSNSITVQVIYSDERLTNKISTGFIVLIKTLKAIRDVSDKLIVRGNYLTFLRLKLIDISSVNLMHFDHFSFNWIFHSRHPLKIINWMYTFNLVKMVNHIL